MLLQDQQPRILWKQFINESGKSAHSPVEPGTEGTGQRWATSVKNFHRLPEVRGCSQIMSVAKGGGGGGEKVEKGGKRGGGGEREKADSGGQRGGGG